MASPTLSSAASPTPPPQTITALPPECMKHDELTAEEQARLPTSRHHAFGFLRRRDRSVQNGLDDAGEEQDGVKTSESDDAEGSSGEADASEVPFVRLEDGLVHSAELDDYSKDVYKWAVLYENQRGVTLFSTRYYSRLSLLPTDPPAFTIPSASKTVRRHHPDVSLSTYPLPDGDWHWVSREWMVDMRGDGQTQYDGFEYNWLFRQKNWRPHVGMMSAGGWVRRRRWVRLMIRPAVRPGEPGQAPIGLQTPRGIIEEVLQLQHHEAGATRPPSILPLPEEDDEENVNVWQGVLEEDWQRCHHALLHLDRDGRKLELWQRWLQSRSYIRGKGKEKALTPKQWTEDDGPLPSQHANFTVSTIDGMLAADTGVAVEPAPREYIASVLRAHGPEILQMFVYPDSRTRFLEMLGSANLLEDLHIGTGLSVSSMTGFWSSSQSLQHLLPSVSSSQSNIRISQHE